GDEYRVVFAVRSRGPQEMKVGPAALGVPPPLPVGVEVIDGRGIRIPLVEGLDFHWRPHMLSADYALRTEERSVSYGRSSGNRTLPRRGGCLGGGCRSEKRRRAPPPHAA